MRRGKEGEGRERNLEGFDPHSVWDELTPMLERVERQSGLYLLIVF